MRFLASFFRQCPDRNRPQSSALRNQRRTARCSVGLSSCIYNDLRVRARRGRVPNRHSVAQSTPIRSVKTSYRKQVIILLSISVFLLLAILVSQTAFDLNFLHPGNNQDIVVFAALSALIFLLFVALTFVLLRNLLKLFAERRLGVLGSKFRTRMVAGALLLSSLPVMVMYWFAYGLMNRSIDKWFSTPVEEVRSDTHAMETLLADYAHAERPRGSSGDRGIAGDRA